MLKPYKVPLDLIFTAMSKLQKRGLETRSIKIKSYNIITKTYTYFVYTKEQFISTFTNIQYIGKAQDVITIEFLFLNNYAIATSYQNTFNVFIENMTSIKFVETKIQNGFKTVLIKTEVDRYKRLILDILKEYITAYNAYYNEVIAIDILGTSYVDSFYVNPKYLYPQVN